MPASTYVGADDEARWDAAEAALPPIPAPPRRVFVRGGQGRAAVGMPQPPGSKYYTLRYLLNALLAEGESIVRFPALSDDTAVLLRAIRALGAGVMWERVEREGGDAARAWQVRVQGTGGRLRTPPDATIQAGNAGAVLRL